MTAIHSHLPLLLKAAAFGQLLVSTLNLRLARILGWERDLAVMPLLMREVFQVHVWFISLTLAIFAATTLRFAEEMNSTPACRWLAGGIALFWAIRTAIQICFYSSAHWRGKRAETGIHLTLLGAYGGFALVYGAACVGV